MVGLIRGYLALRPLSGALVGKQFLVVRRSQRNQPDDVPKRAAHGLRGQPHAVDPRPFTWTGL
jgi:hypothetical protein